MALRTEQFLAQLSPVAQLDFGGGSSMERERLKLAREQFEASLRQHEEEKELRRIEEQGRQARAALEGEQARQKAEADKAAALLAQQQAAGAKFAEHGGNMNPEAMAAMTPYMESLGTGVDVLGQVGGMPTYRVYDKAAEAAAAKAQQPEYRLPGTAPRPTAPKDPMAGLGYPTNERGELGDGTTPREAPLTTASAFEQALAAKAQADESMGLAARAPDEEDYMGAVPRDVIDMGAMKAQIEARLRPGLQAQVDAYTDPELKAQAEKSMESALASGLTEREARKAYDEAQDTHDSTYRSKLALDAAKEKFRETRDELTQKDISDFHQRGRGEADSFAKDNKIAAIGAALNAGDTILEVIDDGNPDNDGMIASELMTFQNVKGTPSDTDLALAFGLPKSTAITQLITKVGELVAGGMQEPQKAAIKKYIEAKKAELEGQAFDYLNQGDARGRKGLNPYELESYNQNLKTSVPAWLYNKWRAQQDEKNKGEKGQGSTPSGSTAGVGGDFGAAIDEQAATAGLDGSILKGFIRAESGGDPSVKNKRGSGATGIIQFLNEDIAKSVGTTMDALGKMSAEEQLPYAIKYFTTRGITKDSTPDDYAMALAAPAYLGKSDDTVIDEYKSGTKKGDLTREQNPGWVPAGGGEITVGSIKEYYRKNAGGGGRAEKAAKVELPEPKTPFEKKYRDLLMGGG